MRSRYLGLVKRDVRLTPAEMCDLIVRPLITEKTASDESLSRVAFLVRIEATKGEIKAAVENLFNVKVEKVNTLISKGKTKRFRGHLGVRSDFKKAYVTLKSGQSIDLTGVK